MQEILPYFKKIYFLFKDVNVYLFVVSLFSVITARKSLQAKDAPRLLIENIRHSVGPEYDTFNIKITNHGNGSLLKAFVIMIKKREYFLSKPIVVLKPGMMTKVSIPVKSSKTENLPEFYIVAQDFFDHYYIVKADIYLDQRHLTEFGSPMKRLYSFSFRRIKILYWMRKARRQNNTEFGRVTKRIRKKKALVKEKTQKYKSLR